MGVPASDKAIFVTGGSGMLGGHLLDFLMKHTQRTVIALKRSQSDLTLTPPNDRIQWVSADLQEEECYADFLMQCDTVVHCAGKVSIERGGQDVLWSTNVSGTAVLVDASIQCGVKKFIHVSSVASLAREKEGLTSEEDHFEVHALTTPYALSKYEGDLEVYRGREEGLNAAIVRPSLIIGSGHWSGGSDSLIETIYRGNPFYPSGGTGVVDVRDVVKLIAILINDSRHNPELICSGHNVYFRDLQDDLASRLGVSGPFIPMNRGWRSLVWRYARLKSFLRGNPSVMTASSLRRAENIYFYDNQKSILECGLKYHSLEQTLNDYTEAFLKYKNERTKTLMPFF